MKTNHNNLKAQKRDMTKGSIWRHVWRMSAPMVVGIGAVISFTIADTYFIGQLGANELAALGYTFPITTFLFNAIFGMAIAMSAVVSRKIGAGLMEEVKNTATIGLAITAMASILLAIMTKIFMDPIFNGLGAGDHLLPLIHDYMNIWLIGSVFLSFPIVANSAIRGMGDAISPTIVMITIAIVNVVLDPIFIFGLFGAPRLEMQGAALASLIACMIGMITALIILGFREKGIKPSALIQKAAWHMAAKALLVIAIPVSLANLITPITTYGYTMILSGLGDAAVAGYGIASRFEAFALIPIMAVAGGISPLIGQNYGAGLTDRVQEAMAKAIKFALVYGILSAVIFSLCAGLIAYYFSDDAQVQSFVTGYLSVVPLSFFGLNVFLVITSSMNAMSRAKTSLVLNIIKAFALAIPTAWVLTHLYSANGFFTAIISINILGMVLALFVAYANRCIWRKNAIT